MRERAVVPRVVLVTRATEYEQLLARHATRGQAAFFLESRGEHIDDAEERHRRHERARGIVLGALPPKWRRIEVPRPELDRFVFEPVDLVVALGPDGLVANTAKYLADEQPVIGINSDPKRVEGVLVQHPPEALADVLADVHSGRAPFERRTMVECRLDDDRRLVALNEVFVGHASHQSARYDLRIGDRSESQSSSGIVVATGTGQTGWCRSLRLERGSALPIPAPTDAALTLFVREAWPSVASGAGLTEALLSGEPAEIVSRMETDGVVFGDGIEDDRLELAWGSRASIGVADRRLCLVPAGRRAATPAGRASGRATSART
jgi:NAD kinase